MSPRSGARVSERAVLSAARLLGDAALATVAGENVGKHVLEASAMACACESAGAVIDLGGGVGVNLLALREEGHAGRLVLVDRFDEYDETNRMGPRELARRALDAASIEVLEADFWPECALSLPADAFDVATCFDVVEHLPGHPLRQLGELRRVLKPGGTCLLGGPNATSLMKLVKVLRGVHPYAEFGRWLEGPYFGHYREYVRAEYGALLERSGFERVESRWVAPVTLSRARARYHRRVHPFLSPVAASLWLLAAAETLFPPLRHSVLALGRKPRG